MSIRKQVTLAAETAIRGGSIALYVNGSEVESIVGDGSISRAEQLLPEIDRLLRSHDLKPADIDLFAVSTGPGSFTGIRVGIATALGLKAAISARFVGISSLEAIALSSDSKIVAVAVPMGRNVVCFQQFLDHVASGPPALLDPNEFSAFAASYEGVLVVEGSLRDAVRETRYPVVDVGYNIASLIATAAQNGHAGDDLTPLFVDRKKT